MKHNTTWFRNQSTLLLAQQIAEFTHPGYPAPPDRLRGHRTDPQVTAALGSVAGKAFAKPSKHLDLPSLAEQDAFTQQGLTLDPCGRPLHPWFEDMLAEPGAALGNGFYWYWGPNKASDGIPVRHDLDEPHMLIGNRKISGKPAFLGGMNEGESDLETAYREIEEESFFNIRSYTHTVSEVYHGPLADIRATAHAWPVTTAFLLNIEGAVDTPMQGPGKSDEMPLVYWHPVSKLDAMFGSHRLIAQIALANLRS